MLYSIGQDLAGSIIGENQQLVTNEPVEVEDCRKITNHFRGIYSVYPKFTKGNQRVSTCHRLDLQTLGSRPVMPKNSPRSLSWIQRGY